MSTSTVNNHKRNRQSDCFLDDDDEDDNVAIDKLSSTSGAGKALAKKPRDDDNQEDMNCPLEENSLLSSKSNEEDYDDDDYDDYDDLDDNHTPPSDMEDYLDDFEDDQSVASASTTVSTGSSVCSNTPSLVGENLESFSLGETEKTAKAASTASGWISTPLVRSSVHPLKRSLFSHVPPTINFVHHNEVSEISLPAELRKQLRWKLSQITPAVVKKVVTNSGFRLMRKTCSEWGGTWGKHMKSELFKDIHEGQKINHLPGTFNIGRKDRLWKNYHRLRLKFGKEEFGFLPRTFCLPGDTKLLRKVWEKRGCRAKWIVKPPALARGTGIKVVNKWSQIPKTRPLIVQKYIAKPHLINDTKYDLRIYVLLTSLNPLRIYLYDEGLVRFASNTYSSDNKSLSDVFTHLTNYSINKNSSSYLPNEDSEVRQGHKWTLGSLWQHFAEQGIDNKPVLEAIKDMVIKTIVSAEHSMFSLYRPNMASHYCGYELFGFDVLLDSHLKPWLIEVNISPSLHSSSPLDLDVKSPLATEVFNLVRYHVPPAKMSAKTQREILHKLNMGDTVSTLCMDRRLYARELSKAERSKQDKFVGQDRQEYLHKLLDTLTPDDVRCLIRSEDELVQATHFTRIFPTQDTHKYFKYFEQERYYNKLMDAWEMRYGEQRAAAIDRLEQLCLEKVHLRVPSAFANSQNKAKKKSQIVDVSMLKAPTGDIPTASVTADDAQPNRVLLPQPEKNTSLADQQQPKVAGVKVSKIGVVAKPHCLKPAYGLIGCGVKRSSAASSSRRSLSSPESMSLGGDSVVGSETERSRSPSPVEGGQLLDNQQQPLVISADAANNTNAFTSDGLMDNRNTIDTRNEANGNNDNNVCSD